MKVWQKQLILFLALAAVGVPTLLFLRGREAPPPSPVYTGPTGEYALALVDRQGRPLSDSRGELQVQLDPFTLYRNRPNQRSKSFNTGPLGFRGGTRGTPGPLAVLGGSTAFGQGLPADNRCFAAQLDELLPGREVVNGAVVGYLAGQELALMVHRMDDLHPSHYVVFDGWNELFDQWLACRRQGPWGHGFMNLFYSVERRLHDLRTIRGPKPPPKDGLTRKEEARRAGITKEMTHRQGKRKDAEAGPTAGERIIGAIQRSYHAALGRMHDFARSRGAGLLVVFQPELGGKMHHTAEEQTEYDRWCRAYPGYREQEFSATYDAFVSRAAAWCGEQGIEYLDLHHHPAFRDERQRLFYDVVHLNEAGHRLAAERIRDRLVTAGLAGTAADHGRPESDR